MRVLLDENLPQALATELTGHEVSSVQAEGWGGTENGALLRQAGDHFDALLSMDRGLAHQQNRSGLQLRIVIIRAPSNRIGHLRPLVNSILSTLAAMRPGQLEVVQTPRARIDNHAKAPANAPSSARGAAATQSQNRSGDDETPPR